MNDREKDVKYLGVLVDGLSPDLINSVYVACKSDFDQALKTLKLQKDAGNEKFQEFV